MEWAGGDSWEQYVDDLESGRESAAIMTLQKSGKMFPKGWEWKGEHWALARCAHLSSTLELSTDYIGTSRLPTTPISSLSHSSSTSPLYIRLSSTPVYCLPIH